VQRPLQSIQLMFEILTIKIISDSFFELLHMIRGVLGMLKIIKHRAEPLDDVLVMVVDLLFQQGHVMEQKIHLMRYDAQTIVQIREPVGVGLVMRRGFVLDVVLLTGPVPTVFVGGTMGGFLVMRVVIIRIVVLVGSCLRFGWVVNVVRSIVMSRVVLSLRGIMKGLVVSVRIVSMWVVGGVAADNERLDFEGVGVLCCCS
jgi:hypothetical protein